MSRSRSDLVNARLFGIAGNLALARALGDFEYKKNPKISPETQIITCDPEIIEHDITEEDEFFIIACDGTKWFLALRM